MTTSVYPSLCFNFFCFKSFIQLGIYCAIFYASEWTLAHSLIKHYLDVHDLPGKTLIGRWLINDTIRINQEVTELSNSAGLTLFSLLLSKCSHGLECLLHYVLCICCFFFLDYVHLFFYICQHPIVCYNFKAMHFNNYKARMNFITHALRCWYCKCAPTHMAQYTGIL